MSFLTPGSALTLAAANVRARWNSFTGALVSVCLGVAILTMTMLVWTSSAAKVPPRLEGAGLIAAGPIVPNVIGTPSDLRSWSSATADDLAHQLSTIPGVEQAAIDRSFYAQATRDGVPVAAGDEALTAGHGWSSAALAPYRLPEGTPPMDTGDVVLDQRLGFDIGEEVSILFASGPRTMTVVGLVDVEPTDGSPAPLDHAVFVTDDLAKTMSPGASAIGLVLSPGAHTDDVRVAAEDVLGDTGTVLAGQDRSVLQPPYIAHDRFIGAQLLTAMAALGGFVSIFIVASTFASNTAGRRQELGLLRIIGALPGQVRRMVLTEAAITGIAGGVIGAALGALAAPVLAGVLLRIEVTTVEHSIEYAPGPILGAVAAGVIVATCGAYTSSRRAATARPMEAIRSASVERSPMTRSRWVVGGVTLISGLGLTVATAVANADQRVLFALLGAMAYTVAATLLVPVVVSPVARVASWPFRRARGATAMLVRAELMNSETRTAGLAAPILATIGFVVLISGYVPTTQVAYPAAVTAQLQGQSIVWPSGRPGLTEAEVREVAQGPVIRAGLATRIFVDKPGQGTTVLDGVGWLSPEDDGPNHAVVSTLLAERFGWHDGHTIDVGFVDGSSQRLSIVAIRDIDPAMAGFNLSRETVRAHDPAALTEVIFIPTESVPADLGLGTEVLDAETFALADYHRDYWLLVQFSLVLIVVTVGYTGIAVANAMAMSMQGRQGFFRVLTMSGGTARQIIGMVTAETLVIVTVGVSIGFAIAVPSLAGIAAGLSESVGRPVTAQLDASTATTATLACFALALGASTLTTWRSLKRQQSTA